MKSSTYKRVWFDALLMNLVDCVLIKVNTVNWAVVSSPGMGSVSYLPLCLHPFQHIHIASFWFSYSSIDHHLVIRIRVSNFPMSLSSRDSKITYSGPILERACLFLILLYLSTVHCSCNCSLYTWHCWISRPGQVLSSLFYFMCPECT
jgi:hypothetical protein